MSFPTSPRSSSSTFNASVSTLPLYKPNPDPESLQNDLVTIDLEDPTTSLTNQSTNPLALFDSVPAWRKRLVVFITSWSALCASFSSTSLLSAAHEVAADLSTTKEVVGFSSGGMLMAMALSSLVWCPVEGIFGRRVAYNACLAVLFAFTVSAALAPNMPVFVVLRILSGLQGCYFHVAGHTIISEYFPPTQRGTAMGFFTAGTLLGPPLGPLIAGIIATYASWRSILWLQAAMIGIAICMSIFFIPGKSTDRRPFKLNVTVRHALAQFNPLPVFKAMTYPNIILTHISCALLSFIQYSLLSAPRHILSTRFHLTSPLHSGLYYIAPACGFLFGGIVGGWYSDHTVKKWTVKRGERLPQDRLKSGMLSFFLIVPVVSLIYGWGLQCKGCSTKTAGLALPIVTSFCSAAGLLAAFASLNTYCAEAMPKKRREVIGGKYLVQFTSSACATAGAVPLMEAIGPGPTATIGAVFALIAGGLTLMTATYGLSMQEWRESKASLVSPDFEDAK